jgi:hypothetical protein
MTAALALTRSPHPNHPRKRGRESGPARFLTLARTAGEGGPAAIAVGG